MTLAIGDRIGVEVMRPSDDGRVVRFLESGTIVAIGEPYCIKVERDNGGVFEGDVFIGTSEGKLTKFNRERKQLLSSEKIIELAQTTRRTMSEITAKVVTMVGSGLSKEQVEQAIEDWATSEWP